MKNVKNIKKFSELQEENFKQEVPPQNREESPFFKAAMKMHKNAKALQNMPSEKHGLSKEEHKKKVDRMHGRYNQLMSKYYGSVGHEYMKGVHDKRAKELMGSDFQEEFETEEEVSHKQKLMDYVVNATEEVLEETKEFVSGKVDNSDKIERRLNRIQEAFRRIS